MAEIEIDRQFATQKIIEALFEKGTISQESFFAICKHSNSQTTQISDKKI